LKPNIGLSGGDEIETVLFDILKTYLIQSNNLEKIKTKLFYLY
jgi:hypothetical protein